MEPTLRTALNGVVGPKGTTEAAVTPADLSEVAGVVRVCGDHGARLAVTSGPAPRGARIDGNVILSLERLTGLEVRPGAMVARAEAGITVAALNAAVQAGSLAMAGPIATTHPAPGHVGSVIARGAVSRRLLCGVEAVLGTGEVVWAGGLVQRDVTGYDLASLLLGSAGRLAVVTAAYLRLQPAGSRQEAHAAMGETAAGQLGPALRLAFDPGEVLVAQ